MDEKLRDKIIERACELFKNVNVECSNPAACRVVRFGRFPIQSLHAPECPVQKAFAQCLSQAEKELSL